MSRYGCERVTLPLKLRVSFSSADVILDVRVGGFFPRCLAFSGGGGGGLGLGEGG